MKPIVEEQLPALFDSAKGGPEAPLAVYRRLQFFARAMSRAPAAMGAKALLLWFDENDEIRSVSIGCDPVNIGRDSSCDVVLSGVRVSRRHCLVRLIGDSRSGGVEIEDLGSSNGTLLNGAPIVARTPIALRDGDVIEVGRTALACIGAD